MVRKLAVGVCIALAVFGVVFASAGAYREVAGPGEGVLMVVLGTIALGFAGIGLALAGR